MMKYHLAMGMNKQYLHKAPWKNLANIMLSKKTIHKRTHPL